MALTVTTAFDTFLANISLTGDHAETAKARTEKIIELLGGKMTIVEAFPTRSIIRGTALKGVADVDVICALHYGKHIKNKTPQQVLESVREALSEYNAQIVKKNGQCVTLYFKSWPNVGIVSACQVANNNVITRYELPDANSGNWIPSNPKLHDAPIAKRNPEKPGANSNDQVLEWRPLGIPAIISHRNHGVVYQRTIHLRCER